MSVAALVAELRPLILLLSSDKDGEVLAAVRMIGRKLDKAGLDWHAFAASLDEPVGPSGERDAHRFAGDWLDVANHVVRNADELPEKDRSFALSIHGIIARGWAPTEKQARWLRALFERTGGEWAEAA